MKRVIILFGEMGAGKNYCGERWAKEFNYEFLDGDTVATKEMIERVCKFQPLTRQIVSEYVDVLAEEIATRLETSENGLIVAQALYCDHDRRDLELFLESLGYCVQFHWIKPSFIQNLKQLLKRPQGWKWVGYWLFNKPFFQKPTHSHGIV